MALSQMAFSAGVATGQPLLIGAGVAGTVLGGVLGRSQANKAAGFMDKAADVGSEITTLQNRVAKEQADLQRDRLMQNRRKLIRQSMQMEAGATAAASASGMSRSTSFGAVQSDINRTLERGTGNIDRALDSGEFISTMNRNMASLQSQRAKLQAKGQAAGQKQPLFGLL